MFEAIIIITSIVIIFTIAIIVRSMWDPFYCCCMTTSDIGVLSSTSLIKISPSVYISEHFINSGNSGKWARSITKFSRMLVVVHNGELCLYNPCPLTTELQKELDELGRIQRVVVTNCFHYAFLTQYIDAYPEATFLVPQGMMWKRPELQQHCIAIPAAIEGSLFTGTHYFRLPDFYQEHVIFVEEAGLLYCSDTLYIREPKTRPHGRLGVRLMQEFIRSISFSQPCGVIHYFDYVRQFRYPHSGDLHKENVERWRKIFALPITRITTGHGVFRGSVSVTNTELKNLLRCIERKDSWMDRAGRLVFRLCVHGAPNRYRDWTCLYDEEAQFGYRPSLNEEKRNVVDTPPVKAKAG